MWCTAILAPVANRRRIDSKIAAILIHRVENKVEVVLARRAVVAPPLHFLPVSVLILSALVLV